MNIEERYGLREKGLEREKNIEQATRNHEYRSGDSSVNGPTFFPSERAGERLKKRPDRNPASCKIQYPMKNRDKDAQLNGNTKYYWNKF